MGVPVRIAQARTETGTACLSMVLAAQGVRVGQEELRAVCGVSRDGTDLDVLAAAARELGCAATVTDGGAAGLASARLPVVAASGGAHTVVVAERTRGGWAVIDPLTGRATWDEAEAARRLRGPLLEVDAHGAAPSRAGSAQTLRTAMTGNWGGVAFVVIAGLALAVPGLITPALVGMFVNEHLVRGSDENRTLILGGLVAALLLSLALMSLQGVGLRRLLSASVTRTSARFLWHLLRMPAWFFSQRDTTTLAYRMGLNERLADALSSTFAAALLAQLTALVYLVAIAFYSPSLALVALLGLLLALALTWRIARLRTEVRQVQAREGAVTATELGVMLRTLETLKATGSEDLAFRRVYGSIGRRLTFGNTHLWAWLSMTPVLAQSLAAALVLGVGAMQVLQGSLTIGGLSAVTMLVAGFLGPITVLVPSIDTALNLRGTLDQLEDVLDQPVDPALHDDYADGPAEEMPRASKLAGTQPPAAAPTQAQEAPSDDLDTLLRAPASRRGRLSIDPWAGALELREVTFGYTPTSAPLLEGVSFTAAPGSLVAIVGASGSGKSTIGRLVAGLYHPWAGSVLFDHRDLLDHDRASRARDIAFVDQDVVLYQATMRENLAMFDPDIPDRDLMDAARSALVYDDIIARPGRLDAVVDEDGRNLSGGQRQRLVIARALVRKPRLLVMDEATSALDARTEAAVVAALRERACTTLIVAHRLSTVRDADEILVMDGGRIVERGTHRELTSRHGLYRRLMDA